MALIQRDLFNSPYSGIFCVTSEKLTLLPPGLSEEELAEREKEQALASKAAQESASKTEQETAVAEKEKEQEKKTPAKKATPKKETKAKAAKGKKADDNADLFEAASEDDDDLF